MRKTLPWKNTHMGLPGWESGHTDTLPNTGADRRPGQANTSTGPDVRLLRPVSPGWGGMAQQAWHQPVLPAITCYPIHVKRLAQRGDCIILRRCSVSPSPQPCRCPPKRRRAPTHGRRQHSEWSEPSPPGGTACLEIGTPRRWPPLSSGPTSVCRQPSLSADLRGRQRAAQSFWSSGWGPSICAMLLRDTATLRLDLPPPRAVLAGSPPDRGKVWWEPWARIQAGVSRQRENSPARTQGTLCLPKTPGGPRPVWWKWAWSEALS